MGSEMCIRDSAYTCPASVPLVLGFRAGKQMIRNAAAREKAKA